MHGATIGDAQQVLSLAFTQRSAQQELPRDVVNLSRAIPALLAIGRVRALMTQPDLDILERIAFSLGVLAQCHGRAGAQRHQQKFIRIGPAFATTHFLGLIGVEVVRTCSHRSPEGVIVLPHPHLARTKVRRRIVSLGSHRQKPRGPGANQVSRILRIGRAREQMVRIVQADETLRMSGRLEQVLCLADVHHRVTWRVHNQQGRAKPLDRVLVGLGLELFNEGRRDPERPAAQVDLVIEAGREALRANPTFNGALRSMEGLRTAGKSRMTVGEAASGGGGGGDFKPDPR